jgi:3-oxoadipate enol-lactonase
MTLAHDDVGDGRPVVLIHGHPFDRTMWAPQLRSLGERYRVIAPDLRGYGASPATRGTVTMHELADDIWALLDEREVEQVAVVGLSMGGLIAMEMAIGRPSRVTALGLIATTARPVTEDERAQRLALADEIEAVGMSPAVESMGPRLFGPDADAGVVAGILRVMAGNDPQGSAAALRGRAQRPDYRGPLGELEMPTFVCTGSEDAYSTAEVTRELVGCLRDPRVVLFDGVGHLPNLERADAFDAELAAFLASSQQSFR